MSDDERLPEDDDLDEPDEQAAEPKPAADASTRRGVRKQELKSAREMREAAEFWRRVFADTTGRREMWKVLASLHTFEDSFAVGPNGFPQVEASWFRAGQSSAGKRLLDSWTILDFLGVYRMRREHDPQFRFAPDMPDNVMDGL